MQVRNSDLLCCDPRALLRFIKLNLPVSGISKMLLLALLTTHFVASLAEPRLIQQLRELGLANLLEQEVRPNGESSNDNNKYLKKEPPY